MFNVLNRFDAEGVVVHVRVTEVRGSAPREVGASMFVFADGRFTGTIGGGTLEWLALAEAQKLFASDSSEIRLDKALGPELGQCCGGRVSITLRRYGHDERAALQDALQENAPDITPLLLFGAGHVGRALVLALAPLPFAVRWVDPREGAFPQFTPANCQVVMTPDPTAEVLGAASGSFVVVMTHSHPLDLAITSLALADGRFGYVGLIGSASKRARFESQMRQAGLAQAVLDRLVCPVGLKEIGGKEPAVIAAGLVAQLLTVRHKLADQQRLPSRSTA